MAQHELWFIRRGGDVRGPFPVKVISQYLLLGRLRLQDEVSLDKEEWFKIEDVEGLVPKVMLLDPDDPEAAQRLEDARRGADERVRERRDGKEVSQEILDMRRGDRREEERKDTIEYRLARQDRLIDKKKDGSGARALLGASVFAGILIAIGAAGYFLLPPSVEISEIDCSASPRPGVDWSNCDLQGLALGRAKLGTAKITNANLVGSNLSGADLRSANLSYTNFSISRLDAADFSDTKLVGANFQRSSLRETDFRNADLSFADFRGADLLNARMEGAKLAKSIWIDGTICADNSIGQCNPTAERAGKLAIPGF